MSNNADKIGGEDPDFLERYRTAQSVNITMEMFEKLYLAPQNRVKGELRKTFANPTPLPLVGFIMAAGPLSCALMGWRGAGGSGAATVGVCYFFGGMLMIIGSVLEWFIGNTFPFVVFGSFGALFLSYAATLTPFYNASAAFTAGAKTAEEIAAGIASFHSSLAFFLLYIALLVFIFLVCSLRTNLVFFGMLFKFEIAFCLLTAAHWKAAEGNKATYEHLEIVSGAFIFALCFLGFYLLTVQLLQSVDFPVRLPVGDLSSRFGGKKRKPSEDHA